MLMLFFSESLIHYKWWKLGVNRVLGPVLALESTATSSFTRRVKPERLAQPGKMGMTTSTIIAKNSLYTQSMYT